MFRICSCSLSDIKQDYINCIIARCVCILLLKSLIFFKALMFISLATLVSAKFTWQSLNQSWDRAWGPFGLFFSSFVSNFYIRSLTVGDTMAHSCFLKSMSLFNIRILIFLAFTPSNGGLPIISKCRITPQLHISHLSP